MARTREAAATLLNQREAWKALKTLDAGKRAAALGDRSVHWLLHPPVIALLGIPNSGKSTLLNALAGVQCSIVADMPGTTRDYVEAEANLGGLAVRLVDTPGVRSSDDAIEMSAIEISRNRILEADLRIVLMDPTQPREEQDELVRQYADAWVVWGKADVGRVGDGLAISARSGEGLADLERVIRRHFGCEHLPHARLCAWTARQRMLLGGE
jgi:tRNA modification GTPase